MDYSAEALRPHVRKGDVRRYDVFMERARTVYEKHLRGKFEAAGGEGSGVLNVGRTPPRQSRRRCQPDCH